MTGEKLLKTLPHLQAQIDSLLEFDCSAQVRPVREGTFYFITAQSLFKKILFVGLTTFGTLCNCFWLVH